jgi:diacylglycerol kinase (ATP)
MKLIQCNNVLKRDNLCRIAPRYLKGTKKWVPPSRPDTPLIVFINAKSGGRIGPRLSLLLSRTLGQSQVFDVTETRPGEVLETFWLNLKRAESDGDGDARYVRQNVRILVAGGDGTVTWVLGCIAELGLDPPPPVAVLPLGTGNDFALNFGWGNAFQWSWFSPSSLYQTLYRFKTAEIRRMDIWTAEFLVPDSSYYSEMPHSLRQDPEHRNRATANFWNYFSIGLDAEAAYGFHALREHHPHLASARLLNQAWYAYFSCSSGWFCGAKPLGPQLTLRVKTSTEENCPWQSIAIPSSIRAIVLLNLQTYGGGRDIWGLPCSKNLERKGFKEPIYDDGLIEVIGLKGGWHTAVVMGQITPRIHAKRLAQAHEVEIKVVRHGRGNHPTGRMYMQLDGEPWPQTIPAESSNRARSTIADDNVLCVRVSLKGSSRVLVNANDILGGTKAKLVTERGSRISKSETELPSAKDDIR